MPNQFFSPEGDLENYFITDYWLIDQYIGNTLWTWGASNSGGRLGNATTTDRSTPITTFAGGTDWKQISTFAWHSAAVKTDGTLWVWGRGNLGQMGNSQTTNRSTPVTTFAGGTNWRQVDVGNESSGAIKTDGTLWMWGTNTRGQLGNNATANASTPVTTFSGGTNWKQVSCGSGVIAAIKTDGTLWMWGGADVGQLGNGLVSAISWVSTPITTFAGGNTWKQVSCGAGNAISAIKTDGTLWMWGRNSLGGLGTNDLTNRSTPVTTFAGGTNWKQSSGGYRTCVAIKTDGTLWTWGLNANGELGNNTTLNRVTPVTTFAGGTNWKQVGGGYSCSFGIKTDGTLWSWGYGASAGLNDTINRLTPVTTVLGGTWKQVTNSGGAITAGTSPNLPFS